MKEGRPAKEEGPNGYCVVSELVSKPFIFMITDTRHEEVEYQLKAHTKRRVSIYTILILKLPSLFAPFRFVVFKFKQNSIIAV